MYPFGIKATLLGIVVATAMSVRGVKRKSLSQAGAIAAWIVGFLCVGSGLRGLVLLMFYQVGTVATKYRKEVKQTRDATALLASVRGPGQVLACSIIAVFCSVAHVVCCGQERAIDFEDAPLASTLTCAIIAHNATCLADTLASELGILARHKPILITAPWREVPPGTNGGVTVAGTAWSMAGGALMGLCTVLMDMLSGIYVRPVPTILFGSICGLLGSFIDSVLGATVQVSYFDEEKKLVYSGGKEMPPSVTHISGVDILTNAQVNFVSALATTVLGGIIIGPFFFRWCFQDFFLEGDPFNAMS